MKSRFTFVIVALVCLAAIVSFFVRVPTTQANNERATTAVTVSQVTAGHGHTCALLSSGIVKCWGYNGEGHLGYGDTVWRGADPTLMGANLPAVDLGTGVTVTKVLAGDFFNCALLNTKQLKCWGRNNRGQLGLGDTQNRGDNPDEMGDHLPIVSIGSNRSVVDFTVGGEHACALLDNGAVKCWGNSPANGNSAYIGDEVNEMGDNLAALDFGTTETVTQIDAGLNHTCALFSNGGVKCWGGNYYGELGIGTTDDVGDSADELGTNLLGVFFGSGRYATAISLGDNTSCAILDNGKLVCWGLNDSGQLGVGNTNTIGDARSELGDAFKIVNVGSNRTVKKVTVGGQMVCATLDNGATKCWGDNFYGELGDGTAIDKGVEATQMGDSLAAIMLGGSLVIKQIDAGYIHICAVLTTGGLKCWGSNDGRQLGCADCYYSDTSLATIPYVSLGTSLKTVPTLTKTKSPTKTKTSTRTATASKTFTPTRTATITLTRTSTAAPTSTPTP